MSDIIEDIFKTPLQAQKREKITVLKCIANKNPDFYNALIKKGLSIIKDRPSHCRNNEIDRRDIRASEQIVTSYIRQYLESKNMIEKVDKARWNSLNNSIHCSGTSMFVYKDMQDDFLKDFGIEPARQDK